MIAFSANPLNRLSEKRADAAWIAEKRRGGAVLPVWRLQPFLTGAKEAPAAGFLGAELVDPLAAPDAPCVFLGMDGERACFALDISAAEDPAAALGAFGQFRDLRAAAPLLSAKDLAILGQARAMIDWHRRHGFCARCGASTVLAEAGYKRVCAACQSEHFPRVDPAVIMLATYGDACLLGRNAKWADFFSALAGFVEPGESIEEAVRRELFEEAGVRAGAVTYVASQPWPFPSQLMIGCFAQCDSRELKLDANELAEAEWLTRERARALLAGGIEGRRGPAPFAIAHHLIREWAGK